MGRHHLRGAARPVLLYLAVACAWIVASDLAVHRLSASTPSLLPAVNIAKGLLFVAVTGLLLFRAMSAELRLVEQACDRVRVINDGLRTLATVQRLLAREDDPRRLAQQLCRMLVDGREVKAAWLVVLDESSKGVRLSAHCVVDKERGKTAVREGQAADLLQRRPAALALDGARPAVVALNGLPADDPQRRLTGVGARVAGAFPLVYQGRVLGVITLYAADPQFFEEARLELVRELADAVAMGLHLASLEQARRESEHLVRLQLARAQALRDRDPLTGLYNRQRFEQSVAEEVEAGRRGGSRFAVMVLDLDRFTEVNARFGHAVGDRVLKAVALRMQQAVRTEQLARIGGDAFAALFPGLDAAQAHAAAQQVLRLVTESPIEVDGQAVTVKARVGVAVYPDHGRTAADLLNALDTALLRAQQQRLALAVFDPASHSLRLASYGRGEELRRALAERRIVPALQPVVELGSGRVFGYEVLARIRRDGGLLEAGSFIPEAEAYGLMEELEAQMLEHVVALWTRGRFEGKRIFVNVALNLLSEESYRELILRALRQHPDLARQLVLELTERHSLPQDEAVLGFMEALKAMGAQVALDDFGSGYSSIGYFRRIPVDYVKIDGSLVKGVVRSELDERVVAAVRRVAVELGAEAVAEWVEDAPTVEALQQLGVRLGQGYYLGRPVVADQLPAQAAG